MNPELLSEGTQYGRHGVEFKFQLDMNKLISSTTYSGEGSFEWKWFILGQAIVGTEPPRKFDCGTLLGRTDNDIMHAILLPSHNQDCWYETSEPSGYEIDVSTKSGLFGGLKLNSINIMVSDFLGISGFAIDQYFPNLGKLQRKSHVNFFNEFGIEHG